MILLWFKVDNVLQELSMIYINRYVMLAISSCPGVSVPQHYQTLYLLFKNHLSEDILAMADRLSVGLASDIHFVQQNVW